MQAINQSLFILQVDGNCTFNRVRKESKPLGHQNDELTRSNSLTSVTSLRWFSVGRFYYNGAEKSHDLLKIQVLSLVENLFFKRKSLKFHNRTDISGQ